MDGERTFETLSSEDHREVWDQTESKFWDKFTREQQGWNASHEQKYRNNSTELRCQLSDLTGRRNVLHETRTRMARDLMKIEEDLRVLSRQCEIKSEELNMLDDARRSEQAAQADHWEWQSRKMTNFFRKKRGERLLKETEDVPQSFPVPPTKAIHASEPMESIERHTNDTASHAPSPHAPTPISEGDRLVDVVDADNNVIGPVQRIEPWNHWVDAVMKLPVVRPVEIRRGRRFTEEHLSTIYERSEAKGVKWLSCMIQATGKVQEKRCQCCEKNQGAFEKCIIVGGEHLSKCGNCEWNRQGCHGASGETVDLEAVEKTEKQRQEEERKLKDQQRKERDDRIAREEEHLRVERQREMDRIQQEERQRRLEMERREQVALAKEAVDAEAAAQSAQWRAVRADQANNAANAAHGAMSQARRPAGLVDRDILMNSTAPPPPSLPEPRPRQPLPGHAPPDPRAYRMTGGFTPANTRSRPPSREMLTPGTRSVEHSPQPSDDGPEVPLTEITKDNLILRHDGNVYTYPECMVGVPVAKIHPEHPYWDPEWKNVRSEIVEAKERWEKKHQAAIDAQARNEKTGSSKYQIGRQVNRGTKILEFLDDETQISPYQLLGKRFMHSSKGGITSYDTLFRLCETLSELSKFNLDITPVDWMRHRLHEIMLEKDTDSEGSLSLPKIVHDFYHDPKLTALRHKHGFKNIGRPSGQTKGAGRPSLGSLQGSPKQPKKRKSTGSYIGMTRDVSNGYSESPLGNQMIIHDEGPFLAARSQQLTKRPRLEERPSSSEDPAEFTDRDTEYDEPLRREDFRLWQVRSRLHASSTQDTQYWSWSPSQRRLEHRVRQGSGWGSLSEPFDFSLRLEEVVEMSHDLKSNRVYIQIPPERDTASHVVGWRKRGDLMVEFRRARTMKRFLGFCQVHGVRIKDLPHGMLSRWEDFKSDARGTRSPEVIHAHAPAAGPLPPPASMVQRARYSHGPSASPDRSPRL